MRDIVQVLIHRQHLTNKSKFCHIEIIQDDDIFIFSVTKGDLISSPAPKEASCKTLQQAKSKARALVIQCKGKGYTLTDDETDIEEDIEEETVIEEDKASSPPKLRLIE